MVFNSKKYSKEVAGVMNITKARSCENILDFDTDNDGLSDKEECELGTNQNLNILVRKV
jgi:hypothetical protein